MQNPRPDIFIVKLLQFIIPFFLRIQFCGSPTLLFLFISVLGFAQPITNVFELKKSAAEFHFQFLQKEKKSETIFLKKTDTIPEVWIHRTGADGSPQYYTLRSNLTAARNIHATELWTGGSLQLNLNGQNMLASPQQNRMAIWEPGLVRLSHQEFVGRVINRDGQLYPSKNNSSDIHATHVSASMVASGIDPDAKGMAWQANLDSYNADNDLAEMAIAASQGLLISNHSYGPVFPGANHWSLGYYDQEAADWDKIAYLAPYYLIVQACGNDRNENTGIVYDLLLGSSNSKNTLQVGAVNTDNSPNGYQNPSSVVMTDFSSFGPTDDGRIKPDLTAPGLLIYSASNQSDQAYAYLSGTSMSSAMASGGALLLQQYFQQLNGAGKFMTASTLKGLMIHSCLEAGSSPGPDYGFGWGLLNLENAASILQNKLLNHSIEESKLDNGQKNQKTLYSNGTESLKITLCWTDPPASPLPASDPTAQNNARNNRSPRLVNDLDIRLYDAQGNLLDMPWKLDPNQPNQAAIKGDNTVDNVEQILLSNPKAGNYTLEISHKNTLFQGNAQYYSLIISGLEQQNKPSNGFYFYPNPVQETLFFNAGKNFSGLQLTIYDMQGKVLNSIARNEVQNGEIIPLKLSFLPSGMYIIKCTSSSSEQYQYRFIKE